MTKGRRSRLCLLTRSPSKNLTKPSAPGRASGAPCCGSSQRRMGESYLAYDLDSPLHGTVWPQPMVDSKYPCRMEAQYAWPGSKRNHILPHKNRQLSLSCKAALELRRTAQRVLRWRYRWTPNGRLCAGPKQCLQPTQKGCMIMTNSVSNNCGA